MDSIHGVRQLLRTDRKELRAYGSILAKRDFTPEESKRFDELVSKVDKCSERLDAMEAVRDATDEEGDNEVVEGAEIPAELRHEPEPFATATSGWHGFLQFPDRWR